MTLSMRGSVEPARRPRAVRRLFTRPGLLGLAGGGEERALAARRRAPLRRGAHEPAVRALTAPPRGRRIAEVRSRSSGSRRRAGCRRGARRPGRRCRRRRHSTPRRIVEHARRKTVPPRTFGRVRRGRDVREARCRPDLHQAHRPRAETATGFQADSTWIRARTSLGSRSLLPLLVVPLELRVGSRGGRARRGRRRPSLVPDDHGAGRTMRRPTSAAASDVRGAEETEASAFRSIAGPQFVHCRERRADLEWV